MKKTRYISHITKNLITIIVTSGIVLLFSVLGLSKSIFEKIPNNGFLILYASVIGLLLIASFISFFSALGLILFHSLDNYHRKKSYLRSIQKVQALYGNFSDITFKDWESSPLSDLITEDSIVSCRAKLNDNGEIIYQIQIDAEMSTKDYVWFLKNFKI